MSVCDCSGLMGGREIMKLHLANGKRLGRILAVSVVGALGATPAFALNIVPTFGAGFGNVQAQNDVKAAIALYNATFNDPITVNFTFVSSGSGLGSNNPTT